MTELASTMSASAVVSAQVEARITAGDVHRRHGEFVLKVLSRIGVQHPHRDDVYQEVMLVVHRRLDSYAGTCAITTWLFEICVRVTAAYRRRAYFRREMLVPDSEILGNLAPPPTAPGPDRLFEEAQTLAQLNAVLARLRGDQREILTMFELDELGCDQIAEFYGIPIGTVYSRLHRARLAFLRGATRQHLHDAHTAQRR